MTFRVFHSTIILENYTEEVVGFDYARLADEEKAREDLVQTKGYFIILSELFYNVKEMASSNENLNETLESVFRNIESSVQGYDREDSINLNSRIFISRML